MQHKLTANTVSARAGTLPPSPPRTCLGLAQSLLPALKLLARAKRPNTHATCLLAAHVLECVLNACLCGGHREMPRSQRTGAENLLTLWHIARQRQRLPQAAAQEWVKLLSAVHRDPNCQLYATRVHLSFAPSVEPMVTKLARLVEAVGETLRVITPDVRAGAEAVLMCRWSKLAKPQFDEQGRLPVWE